MSWDALWPADGEGSGRMITRRALDVLQNSQLCDIFESLESKR